MTIPNLILLQHCDCLSWTLKCFLPQCDYEVRLLPESRCYFLVVICIHRQGTFCLVYLAKQGMSFHMSFEDADPYIYLWLWIKILPTDFHHNYLFEITCSLKCDRYSTAILSTHGCYGNKLKLCAIQLIWLGKQRCYRHGCMKILFNYNCAKYTLMDTGWYMVISLR